MTTVDYAPGQVIESVPLFPLPGVVFFPGTLLPLHIFEPRYRVMTEHVLNARKRHMVVGLISGSEPVDAFGHPPVADLMGIGEVIEHQKLPDGRYNIVLVGRARVRILEELPFDPPYRRVRAQVLDSSGSNGCGIEPLVTAATQFLSVTTGGDLDFDFRLPPGVEPGTAADLCAHQLIVDPADRQRILETLDVSQRVRCCAEVLATQLAMLQSQRVLH